MAKLFCRLCLTNESNEYFTISGDFRDKILKFLNVQLAENNLICSNCCKHIETFDQYYHQIHNAQKRSQQKDQIRYIILLDKPDDIQFKEVQTNLDDDGQQITLINIPEGYESLEQQPDQELLDNLASAEPLLNSNLDEDKKLADENELNIVQQTTEPEIISPTTRKTTLLQPQIQIEGFPKILIEDGKLVVKGKELSKLIARFYTLECLLCNAKKKFRKLSAMLNHFKSQHSTKGFVTCCGIKIVKLRQIAMHMVRHIQPEAFTCPVCSKLLTCPKILQFHVQNHLPEQERSLACIEPGCTRRFSYQSALLTHSITHIPEEERASYTCCGRKFSTASRLTSHVNSVHSKSALKKNYSCEKCSKSFLCKSNLAYHLTTHKNFEFQVQCTICEKWLKNKICLRKHMTMHSDVRHFCDICEYSAVNRQCLINHKKIQHSDSKPFTCEVCSKSFKLKNTLTNHMNAHHNGVRKYTCEFCQRTFVSSGNYYSHRKRMHPTELKMKLQEKEINDHRKRLEIQHKKLEQN